MECFRVVSGTVDLVCLHTPTKKAAKAEQSGQIPGFEIRSFFDSE